MIAAESVLMSARAQVAVVVAGYANAILAGVVTGWIYDARVAALPYDTSGGMYAGGHALSSIAAFVVVASIPTLLALWFLRANAQVWNAIAIGSIGFAATGLVAVLMPLVVRSPGGHIVLALLTLVALAQLLGVPLWSVGSALCALLAPTPQVRRKLLVAVGIELVIAACAAVHWLVPAPPI